MCQFLVFSKEEYFYNSGTQAGQSPPENSSTSALEEDVIHIFRVPFTELAHWVYVQPNVVEMVACRESTVGEEPHECLDLVGGLDLPYPRGVSGDILFIDGILMVNEMVSSSDSVGSIANEVPYEFVLRGVVGWEEAINDLVG